ncbi:MAG TPA: ATP-binding protein [Kofleriaceae bacterium]|nr:ATP-binding protein [Kofleriaceae bacterium]
MLRLVQAPVFLDEEHTRQAQVLRLLLLWVMLVITTAAVAATLAMPAHTARWATLALSVDGSALLLLGVNRRGHVRLASTLLVVAMSALATLMAPTAGGIGAPAAVAYVVLVFLSGVLLGHRASMVTAAALGLVGLGLVYLDREGLLPARTVFHTPVVYWITNAMYIALAVVGQWLSLRSTEELMRGARRELVERRRAEDALSASEARFRVLAGASFEGVGLTDRGVIVDANDQLAAMMKTSREAMVGRRVMDFIAPESRALVSSAVESRSAGPYEHMALAADGTRYPVEVRAGDATVADRLLRVTVIRDLTFRDQAEAALRESADRLRSLGDNLPDGVIYQVIGECDGSNRLAYVSAGVQRLLGVSPEAALREPVPFLPYLFADDRAVVVAKLEESRRDMTILDVEVRLDDAGGPLRWAHMCSAPRRLPDHRTLWDGFLIDITRRKRAEEERIRLEAELRQSQKLGALGALAGGVAHDFNNILTAIKGNTQLAMEDLPAGHPLHVSLAEIAVASERAAELVRRILAFSRQQDVNRRSQQLRPLVDEALSLLRATLPATVRIRADLTAEIPAVSTDGTQIHQIVMNLGVNAADAMAERTGSLDVRLDATIIAAGASGPAGLSEGRYVRLSVRDDGRGMDRALLARIFQPFFTTKPPGAGTGLGLSLVQDIMKGHGGAIAVDSVPGKGTEFHLYFPAVDAAAADEPAAAPIVLRGRGERVLYVDDDKALVLLITRMLSRLGYRVTGFTDPLEALNSFRSHPGDFDVVVTDVTMPGLAGPELARELLAVCPGLPIILTTGFVGPEDGDLTRRAGAQQLILKPNTIDELGAVLHRLLSAPASAAGTAESD